MGPTNVVYIYFFSCLLVTFHVCLSLLTLCFAQESLGEDFVVVLQEEQLRELLRCVAVCCSVLQCVAVCCSVLQCVAESQKTLTDPIKCQCDHLAGENC